MYNEEVYIKRYKFLTEFAIYPCGCDIPKGAICPYGLRKGIYIISQPNGVRLYRI